MPNCDQSSKVFISPGLWSRPLGMAPISCWLRLAAAPLTHAEPTAAELTAAARTAAARTAVPRITAQQITAQQITAHQITAQPLIAVDRAARLSTGFNAAGSRILASLLALQRLVLRPLPARFLSARLLPGRLGGLLLALALGGLLLLDPTPALAADLQVSDVRLERCPADDIGSQPDLSRPAGASCYALRGVVVNPTSRPVIDTDVFARILDASGEPVLPNRTRVGSIGDIPPGRSDFALRLAVPAGTPEPLTVRNAKARGFSAPVRTRVAEGEERLPLEQALALQ